MRNLRVGQQLDARLVTNRAPLGGIFAQNCAILNSRPHLSNVLFDPFDRAVMG
jgi:hypothetical protein